MVNSRLSQFPATPSPSVAPHRRKLLGHPFFRRYGVNLPSSLTEVGSFTWGGFSLPTGVGVRYGQNTVWLAAFLGGVGRHDFRPLARTRGTRHALMRHGFACVSRFVVPAHPVHSMGSCSLPRPRLAPNDRLWCRNFRPAFHRLRRDVLGLGPDSPWDD